MGMPALKMTSLDLAYGGGMRMPFEMASWTADMLLLGISCSGDNDCHDATERQYCDTAILRAHNNSTENERLLTYNSVCFRLFDGLGFSARWQLCPVALGDANLLNKMMATTSLCLAVDYYSSWSLAVYFMEIPFASLSLPMILMVRWRSGQ